MKIYACFTTYKDSFTAMIFCVHSYDFIGIIKRRFFTESRIVRSKLKTNQIARIETRIYKMAACFFRRVFLMHFTWE